VVTTASDAHTGGRLDLDDLQSERGARSLVWLASSEDGASLTGEYVVDEKVATPNQAAHDDGLASRLWERSAQLVGVEADQLS
jgi:retinol dehydrogenase 12